MISGFVNMTPNTVSFLALSGSLVLLAWSPWRECFLEGLALAAILMLATWLKPVDVFGLLIFLAGPYLVTKTLWGRKDLGGGSVTWAVLIWQVFLFLVIKRYSGFDIMGGLGYPVAVIGISYILFRQIHLVVDAPYLAHLPFNLLRYVTFTVSPWTLIAGPIQRYDSFFMGLEKIGRPENTAVRKASHRVVNGLLKAFVVAPIFLEPSAITNLTVPETGWIDFFIVLYGYPIYLFLNFSGYVDIVIGVACLCGFTTLPENFNRPYLARNPADFWTRWHMSFGVWVRHYVFTPLSSYLIKRAPPRFDGLMLAITVLVTFYLVGAWHGTTINFVVFGLLQGTGVVVSSGFGRWLKRRVGSDRYKAINAHQGLRWLAISICFNFTCTTFLLLNNTLEEVVRSLQAFLS